MAKKEQIIITDDQKQAIDDYGNRIVTIKDTVEIVRKRPGMYGGGKGNPGFLTLIREIYQNGIDQVVDPSSPASHIIATYDERSLEFSCTDDGMGFPYHDMVRMVTEMHTSKNFVKTKKGEYSSGLHGAGIKVVNALSLACRVESYKYDGTAMAIDLDKGYLAKGPYKIPNKEKFQGSRVSFIPDLDIMGELSLGWKEVYILIKRILSLSPLGSIVDFKAIDINGIEHNEHIVNTDGILTELINNVGAPIGKPIVISEDNGEYKLDLAFVYDAGGKDGPTGEMITSFCNMCPTALGPHISGSIDTICKWFVSYMNNIYLAKSKSKLKITSADIKCGLNVMISAACLEPTFIGQAKEILADDPEMKKFCNSVVNKGLEEWSKTNPQQLIKLSEWFKSMGEIRTKAESSKSKVAANYGASVLNGMPKKFIAPTKRNFEFFIVEGDSAKSPAENGRDSTCQGIFPIRGKISSAYSKSHDEFWSNAEVKGISTIILGGKKYWRDFDPIKDVEWDKIIFMADADVDGAHISSLLLRFMVRYMPQLIKAGKVYKVTPPLYGVKSGNKYRYYADAVDFVRFVQKEFIKNNIIQYPDGTTLQGKDITVLFLVNEDYIYYLETIANNHGVEPELLEVALYNYIDKVSFNKINKTIKDRFRFMSVAYENKQIIYDGTSKESNFLPINDRLLNSCKPILDILEKNVSKYYRLNGKTASLYDIMKSFNKSKPSGISRYKGLGEMDSKQLKESTLLPDSDRTLIRYTFQDMKEEIEAIREFESDRSKLMQFVGTVKRVDLLE